MEMVQNCVKIRGYSANTTTATANTVTEGVKNSVSMETELF